MPKSKYATHVEPKLPLIEKWARNGLTVEQIAQNLGIHPATFYKYQSAHRELSESLKNGREIADAHIENKLYQSAIGYYYTEQVMAANGDIKEIERYAKPNTTAQIFWLKNRDPEVWRDKHDFEHSGEVTTVNEQRTHIIHELISDPSVAERIRHNFRRGIVSGASP